MSDKGTDDELMSRVSQEFQVSEELLRDLVALESEFPDVNVWGAKSALGRRIAEILDRAAQRENRS